MTQEEKQLLLKDLCARLPYGVKMWFPSVIAPIVLDEFVLSVARRRDEEFKPYLRPMSSMTDEEKKKVYYFVENHKFGNCSRSGAISDYLNSIHIDYRGLIEKGLALEASEEMYKTE